MNALADLFTTVFLIAGLIFFVAGTVGLLRFPDLHSRLHALTKADNIGLGLVAVALMPQAPSIVLAVKLVLIWLFVLLASAAVSQLTARSALDHRAQLAPGRDE